MDITSYLLGKKSSGGGGVNIKDYFNDTINYGGYNTYGGWKNYVKKLPDEVTLESGNLQYLFYSYQQTEIPKMIKPSNITITNCSYMFSNCRKALEFDLSYLDLSSVTDVTSMFNYCQAATKIDIRSLDNTKITNSQNMMYLVPNNCLIIVKDTTVKNWLKNKFSNLSNIKTVEEYEGN